MMRKWVTKELVLKFISENKDKRVPDYVFELASRKCGELHFRGHQATSLMILPATEFSFGDFWFRGEWFIKYAVEPNEIKEIKNIKYPSQQDWRAFMAKECGEEYVVAYKEFMETRLEETIKSFHEEMESLKSI